jgi:hypothetical protein
MKNLVCNIFYKTAPVAVKVSKKNTFGEFVDSSTFSDTDFTDPTVLPSVGSDEAAALTTGFIVITGGPN